MKIGTPKELELFERYQLAVVVLRDLLAAVENDRRTVRGDYFHERKEARRVLAIATAEKVIGSEP